MEALGALKQRHLQSVLDNDDELPLLSPQSLVDVALLHEKPIRSPFTTFLESQGKSKGKELKRLFTHLFTDEIPSEELAKPDLERIDNHCHFTGTTVESIESTDYQLHYTLPTPINQDTNHVTGELQFSEHNVREVMRYMTREIGYRVVGTEQEVETK
ncbi:hypothetical protein BGW38_005404, partial [Lunasporangiospora selenospora]